MKDNKYRMLLIYTLTVCIGSAFLPGVLYVSAGSSAGGEIAAIQKTYEKIEDLSGNFTQKSHIKDLNRTESFSGQFFIKRPAKIRWDYKSPDAQEILIKNGTLIIYQKKEKQAFRGKFDRGTYGQAPVALLSGFGAIEKEFSISKKNGRLFLKPKKPMGAIMSIEIEYTEGEFPIRSFIINDSYSNRTEIILKNVKINSGLDESLFDLSLPEGVNIYEYIQ
ncbi:MAG: outer membrane lipoprotein carrier protein LolA [Nitrospirota bacterium]